MPLEIIQRAIYVIRGQKMMLDADLARLYGVETKALNRAVRRNASRFPTDFMFQLTSAEAKNLRCQTGTSSYGGRRYVPYAFTKQGVAMLSYVLNSERAALERKITGHDEAIQNLFDALRAMLAEPPGPRRPIGFNRE